MSKNSKKFVKQSRWVLGIQLVGIELIVLLLYIFLRIIVISLDLVADFSPFIIQIKISEAIIFIILSIIQSFLVISAVITWSNESYLLYKNTLTHKRGLVTLKQDVYYLNDIQDLQVRQGFLSRVFNFGSVKFYSPALGRKVTIMNIPEPKLVGDLIAKIKDELPPSEKDNITFVK